VQLPAVQHISVHSHVTESDIAAAEKHSKTQSTSHPIPTTSTLIADATTTK